MMIQLIKYLGNPIIDYFQHKLYQNLPEDYERQNEYHIFNCL